jgi:hypothetical protein
MVGSDSEAVRAAVVPFDEDLELVGVMDGAASAGAGVGMEILDPLSFARDQFGGVLVVRCLFRHPLIPTSSESRDLRSARATERRSIRSSLVAAVWLCNGGYPRFRQGDLVGVGRAGFDLYLPR